MQKPAESIDFNEISSIPQLVKDFLNQKLTGFEDQLFSVENVKKKIAEKKEQFIREKRDVLVSVLEAQMGNFKLSELQLENLNLLKSEETFTITTGHQLNLFTGPAFFIYKILQTVKTAAFLNAQFSTEKFVPVFWMATEDHDFEEINHFKTENGYYATQAKAGQPVGRIKIEDLSFATAFEAELKDAPYGTELIRWLKDSYTPGRNLAEATRLLVQNLFADYGLLILDGDNAELKTQMKGSFLDELENLRLQGESHEMVKRLQDAYGNVQVNPRDINLFLIEGDRERIDPVADGFQLADSGTTYSREELLQKLENNPEFFSPNALMRPLYQETVLPNIAYIGGNAEIMYWLELKDYFAHQHIPFPILIPRNSLLFLSEKVLAKINKLGLETADFFKNFSRIVSRELLKDSELLESLNFKENTVASIFSEIEIEASATDPTFKNLVNAEKTRQLKSFSRMKKRLLRAEKIKQKEKVGRLESLFLEVHPGGNWQERVLNFSVFYSQEGRDWIASVYNALDPTKSNLIIMPI